MARRILSSWEGEPVNMTLTEYARLVRDLPVKSRICSIDKTALCRQSDLIDPKFNYWCLEKRGEDHFINLVEKDEAYTYNEVLRESLEQWGEPECLYEHVDDCGIMIFVLSDNDKQKWVPILMVSAYAGFIIVDDINVPKDWDGTVYLDD